jgi:Sulfotransferase family
MAGGIFMGNGRNESEDSVDFLRLIHFLVDKHYPDYWTLFRDGDPELEAIADSVLERHLNGHQPGKRWGWKLCETLYILPVLLRIFPQAFYIHLIRDGRDVAFSDHVAPTEPFWRKVYFDTDKIKTWEGRKLSHRSYKAAPHVFNARHWVNSVTVARHYGAVIGERYFEVRYEDLACTPRETARRLLGFLEVEAGADMIEDFAGSVNQSAVGKHRLRTRRERTEALRVLRPALDAMGYHDGSESVSRWQRLFRW